MTDPLRQLTDEGVAIWLDDMSRGRLVTDGLADLVRDKHVVGVTTNPTIFQKAISEQRAPTTASCATSRSAASTSRKPSA